jgi:hypothetical protein
VLGGLATALPASAAEQGASVSTDLRALLASDESAPAIDDIVLNIGADDRERNLAWFSTSGVEEQVQIAPAAAVTKKRVFPVNAAKTVAATGGTAYDTASTYHHASLTDLAANKQYVYRVGSDQGGWSEAYTFATEGRNGDYNFLFMGDPQIGSSGNVASDTAGWGATVDTALAAFPGTDFILSAGDQVNTAGNEAQYDGFFAPEQLTSIPLATNIGNHDVGSTAYAQHFNMPNVSAEYGLGSAGQSGGDYWYIYKDVLFLSVNSNDRDNEEHLAFLHEILAEQGSKASWTVLNFHHSIYSTASHANDGDIVERRAELSAGISELGIDLVLMGHDHVYVRTPLMEGTNPVENTGGSTLTPEDGQVLYVTANSSSGSKHYSIKNQPFAYASVQNQERVPNYSNVEVSDDALTVTTYRSSDSSVVDEVTIAKAARNQR